MITETGPTYATYTEPALPSFSGAGSIITDPTFNTRILKLTDSGDSATGCTLAYSYYGYFNSNMTRIMCGIYDSYYKLKVWDWNPTTMQATNGVVMPQFSAGIQFTGTTFSRLDPDKVWCAIANSSISKIFSYKPSDQTNTLVKDFSAYIHTNYGASAYLFQMSVDDAEDIFAGHIIDGTTGGYIVWRKSDDTYLETITGLTMNECHVDKSGLYVWAITSTQNLLRNLTSHTDTVVTGLSVGTHIGCQTQQFFVHGDTNTMAKRLASSINSPSALMGNNLWSSATQQDHFSMNGPDEWGTVSRYHLTGGTVSNPFDNEVTMVKTDGSGNARRICHHRAVFASYYDAPFASASFDNSFVIFSSNWGTGAGRYDVYVAEVGLTITASAPIMFVS